MKGNATFKLHVTLDSGKTIAYVVSGYFKDANALADALIGRIEDGRDAGPAG